MLLAVVKAFAYGSDAVQIAHELVALGVDYFAVAYVSEGVALRKAGIQTPILVLHPQPINFNMILDHDLEPSLYSFKTLVEFAKIAEANGQKSVPVHIKFNTGLNRLGFQEPELIKVTNIIKAYDSIKVQSVFSHLAASEDLKETAFTQAQITRFKSIAKQFQNLCGYSFIKHLCNTSGVVNFPEAQFDMVRCGIGLYGYDNMQKDKSKFAPVATLKTVISQLHTVNKEETVGYNRAFKATQDLRIATLPIGHADGIGRQYGNGVGVVCLSGQKAPIVGNVCMDMIMVDVTNIECEEGDEVVLFDQENTAEDFSKAGNTIPYELLTAVSQRVKRVFVTE